MILNLEPYQVPQPYPGIKGVRPDKELAASLTEGYSGAVSELTTVLQYAYHSLRCKARFPQIAQAMRGIFYVETLHLEFIGACINQLGGEAQYILPLQNHTLYWQANLVTYETTPSKMLLADIEGEKAAAAYYKEKATAVKQPEVAKLLRRLGEDEELHVRILTDLYRQTFR